MTDNLALSTMDDYFVHQLPEPVQHVGTSDRNFYDRHYFNVHASRDDFFLIMGLGQYPNLGTQDGFVSVRRGNMQTTLRTSRAMGDRGDMSCGPIRVEVVQGLKQLRITIAANESGIEADLVFNGTHEPKLEPRQVQRQNGRVIHDVMRYCQTSRYEGWLKFDGMRINASDLPLRGYRDRSWGIRSVGGEEPIGRGADPAHRNLFGTADWRRLHMACQFDDYTINIKLHEDPTGVRSLEDAVRVWNDGRPPEALGRPELEFTQFSPDRRFVQKARITFERPDGTSTVMQVRQLLPLYLEAGTGYGHRPEIEWVHGQYRGELVTDVVRFDVDRPSPILAGPIDCLAEMELDGHLGHGLFEYAIFGRIDGFEGPGNFNRFVAEA